MCVCVCDECGCVCEMCVFVFVCVHRSEPIMKIINQLEGSLIGQHVVFIGGTNSLKHSLHIHSL